MQEHGALNPVKAGVCKLGEIGGVSLHEGDVVDAQAGRPGGAVAQHGSADINGGDLRVGEGGGHGQHVVAEAAAEVQDAARLPMRVMPLQVLNDAASAAVGVAAQQAARGDEHAGVVVGRRR